MVLGTIGLVGQETKIEKKVVIRRLKGVSALDPRNPKIILAILIINLDNKFDSDLTEYTSKAWPLICELDSIGENVTTILLFN